MANKKPQLHVAGDGGDSQTIVLRRHTLRKCCIAAAVVAALLSTGTLLGARFHATNQDLQQQVDHLTTRLHAASPHTIAALQRQIDSLKHQLDTTRSELAARSARRAELIHQYEQQISELKKKQEELLAVKTARLDERNKALNSRINRSAGTVKVMNDPRHSGGLFIASSTEAGGGKLGNELDVYLDKLENLPLGKPVSTGISSAFGYRTDPLNRKKAFHSGLDFQGSTGDPVTATGSGTVKESKYAADYGEYIRVVHGNGFETLFAHLSKRLVKRGDRVVQGQQLGLVGNTGRSSGSHLHYEIHHRGKPVDPMHYIQVAGLGPSAQRASR